VVLGFLFGGRWQVGGAARLQYTAGGQAGGNSFSPAASRY